MKRPDFMDNIIKFSVLSTKQNLIMDGRVSLLGYETAGNFAGIMLAVRRILGGPGAFRP